MAVPQRSLLPGIRRSNLPLPGPYECDGRLAHLPSGRHIRSHRGYRPRACPCSWCPGVSEQRPSTRARPSFAYGERRQLTAGAGRVIIHLTNLAKPYPPDQEGNKDRRETPPEGRAHIRKRRPLRPVADPQTPASLPEPIRETEPDDGYQTHERTTEPHTFTPPQQERPAHNAGARPPPRRGP